MQRLKALGRRYWLDVAIVFVAIEVIVELIARRGSPNAPTSPLEFAVPALLAPLAAVLARRRFPFAGPAAFWILGAAISSVDGRLIPFLNGLFTAGIVASFLLGNFRDALRVAGGGAVVLAGAVIVVYDKPQHATGELVFVPVAFGVAWLAGFLLRSRTDEVAAAAEHADAAEARAAQAERDRESSARVAVAEERARIARELHDVVAHSVSVMVLQAGAVRHRLPDALLEESAALKTVEETGRSALVEMRRLLGAMRQEGDEAELEPNPSLRNLEPLVATVERAGLPVRVHVDGTPFPLPPALDLSGYRIVQEGLTNALKHSRANVAEVTLRYRPTEITIEVKDDGRGDAESDGLGHGLVGIRERVKIFGGEMRASRAADGGFLLWTRLPVAEDAR